MTTNYEDIIVYLPDLIRGGRNPWSGSIAKLMQYKRDTDMTAMIDYVKDAGLYCENGDDNNLWDVLPKLLATDIEALRKFTDDPNAIYAPEPQIRLRWETWENYGFNPDGSFDPYINPNEGATLFLERLEGDVWFSLDFDGFEFDDHRPADDPEIYEAVEQHMRSKHNLPDDIEIEMPC